MAPIPAFRCYSSQNKNLFLFYFGIFIFAVGYSLQSGAQQRESYEVF